MNIADYLSELLFSNNEVSVPGLGYFSLIRKSAWYNAKEATFYPPYHQVSFISQPKDDETFINYLSDRRGLSPEASKSLIDGFVADLNKGTATKNIVFGGLGWFYKQDGHLVFKANDKIVPDPYFFGFSPAVISKLQGLEQKTPPSSSPEKTTAPETIENESAENEVFEEGPVVKRRGNIWLVTFLIIIIAALAVFGVYQYNPQAFAGLGAVYQNIAGNNKKAAPPVLKINKAPDTLQKKDTLAGGFPSENINGTDTTKTKIQPRWEIIVESFKTSAKAGEQVAYYKSLGLNARIVEDTASPSFKRISVGSFLTLEEADSAKVKLVKAGKISKDAQSIKVTPTKQ